jgi:hypothetical protein
LYKHLSEVYAAKLMRLRLLTAVLVLMLSGSNCDASSICANRCTSSSPAKSAPVENAVVHHHQMESQPAATNIGHPIHNHRAQCIECPPELGNSLKSAGCAGLAQIQAIEEGVFSLGASSGVAYVRVPNMPADALPSTESGNPSLFRDFSRRIGPSNRGSISLRI